MNPAADDITAALQREASWLSSLAYRLIRDPGLADDVVQQTWTAAIQNPPPDGLRRGWLATVMRNFARSAARQDVRRREREQRVAAMETVASTDEIADRMAIRGEVIAAVLELDEPYRSTVLLRYYEDLPPREIARRQEVPVETVKTRIKRAHYRIRTRLDHCHGGDRQAWVIALIPVAKEAKAAGAVSLGVLMMSGSAKLILTSSVVILTATAAWLWRPGGLDVEPSPGTPIVTERPAAPATDPESSGDREQSSRSAAAPPDLSTARDQSATHEPKSTSRRTVRARVIDAAGEPAAGVAVSFAPFIAPDDRVEAVSDNLGHVELEAAAGIGHLVSADPRFATVYNGSVGEGPNPTIPVVVVAPIIDVAGLVVDESGRPVPNAQVSLIPRPSFDTRFAMILDHSARRTIRAKSDGRGRFELDDLPQIDDADITITARGFEVAAVAVPATSDHAFRVVLHREDYAAGKLEGQVLDEDGRPAADALLTFGYRSTTSDAHGRFTFEIQRSLPLAQEIRAVKKGHLPATLDRPADGWAEGFVTLRLGGSGLTISGVVLDDGGEPVPLVNVRVADGEVFGLVDHQPRFVEELVAGVESGVRTKTDGSFVLQGLADREYRLVAQHPITLGRTTPKSVRAGSTGVVLTLSSAGWIERLEGVVVTREGDPVPSATVTPRRAARVITHMGATYFSHDSGAATTTDEQGRFTIEQIPPGVALVVSGDNVVTTEQTLPLTTPSDRTVTTRIEIARRRHFQVEIDASSPARHVSLLDGIGATLDLYVVRGGGSATVRSAAPLMDGRSVVLSVSEDATTLVLLSATYQEIRRIGITLRESGVTILRP